MNFEEILIKRTFIFILYKQIIYLFLYVQLPNQIVKIVFVSTNLDTHFIEYIEISN